jgi:FixJ family two-component response regulator
MLLLVDDEKDILNYFKTILESFNLEVDSYTDSPKALQAYEDNPDKYTHVILDVFMPMFSGIDLAERMKIENPSLPIMFLTGLTDSYNIRKIEKLGEYMSKETIAPDAIKNLFRFVS